MTSASLPAAFCCVLVGLGMTFVPEGTTNALRTSLMDIMQPGQQAVRASIEMLRDRLLSHAFQVERTRHGELSELQMKLDESNARITTLVARLTLLSDKQLADAALPSPVHRLPRLVTTSLIEANILGEVVSTQWRSGKLLDRGDVSGVRESSLVLNSCRSLVDVGQDGGLTTEDRLIYGRTVIGKIDRVGRWTSTCILLTDEAYRGRAQLIHESDAGFVFGAKGILRGQGSDVCSLEGVSTTESVGIGDTVFTADRGGISETPLYYGKVVEAGFGPEDREWKVLVQPAAQLSQLKTAQILRMNVSTERLAAGR